METLDELFDNFILIRESTHSDSPVTLRGYRAAFELLKKIMPSIDLTTIADFHVIEDFFTKLNQRKRLVGRDSVKVGVKKSTVATYYSKLNKFCVWLERGEHIKKNPFDSIDFPRVYYDNIKFLNKGEVKQILHTVSITIRWGNLLVKKRNELIFLIPLYCGLRRGELLGLDQRDIDLKKKQLTVRAECSKSKRDRIIPLHFQVVQALQDYLAEREKTGCTTPALLVSANRDDRFTGHGLKHLVEQVVAVSGIKFHLHRFRHTFAVNYLHANENDVVRLMQLMGHRSIRMTLVYLRCLPAKMMADQVERLDIDSFI